MDYDRWRSLPAMFLEQADRRGEKPFLWAKRDGCYRPVSWVEAARDVRHVALALRSLGIGRGERVALVSENRPEWIIADLAIMSAGAITVPAYVTNTIEDHRHILANSGASAAIVSKTTLSARVLAAANQVDTVHTVIAIEPAMGQASAVDLMSWDGMLALGAAMEKTGAAHLIASGVTGAVGHFGPRVTLSVMYLLATLLTELISNNAVALLLTPIAFEIAATLGVDARPFAVAVMFGCAASFATPIGHQTNTYVFGAGGYRFADFPKIGVPLNVILWIVGSILIPIFWPFVPK